MRWPTLLPAVVLVAACSADRGTPITWQQLDMGKLVLELEDEDRYELLQFHAEGAVSATIGSKKGPLAAPLLYWHVESNRLVITESPGAGTVVTILKEPRIEGKRLSVSVSGQSHRTYVVRSAA